jgi:hypothetical protein
MVICSNCRHFCKPKARPVLNLGKSDGSFKALEKWASSEDQRHTEEDRRVQDPRYKFDYEPFYSPWCRKFTPGDGELENAKKALIKGDTNWHEDLKSKEMDVVIYPATGHILPVYVLCDRKNAKRDCKGFEPNLEKIS